MNDVLNWSKWQIQIKIQQLMDIEGPAGILVKVALLGGFGRSDLLALHRTQVCPKNIGCCFCGNLHITCCENELQLLSLPSCHDIKKRFAILPKGLWLCFKCRDSLDEHDILLAEASMKLTGLFFGEVRLISEVVLRRFYCTDCSTKPESIRRAVKSYCALWEDYGVLLNFE
jgi:hypothetical protein